MRGERLGRIGLRTICLVYLALLLVAPLALVFSRTFEGGLGAAWDGVTTPAALNALRLTLIIAVIAVPLNAIFGVMAALVLVRGRVPGRRIVSAFVDLPLALSPVVIGLALVLVWNAGAGAGAVDTDGWFGGLVSLSGWRVIYALPGMVLATIFVSLPFVVREVVPVLRAVGDEQEQAAATLGAGSLQTFWRITLPAIRWGLAYGVILTTARAIGEYGAVAVVSGKILERTQTLTLHVEERLERLGRGPLIEAYGASVMLAGIALVTVLVLSLLNRKGGAGGYHGH